MGFSTAKTDKYLRMWKHQLSYHWTLYTCIRLLCFMHCTSWHCYKSLEKPKSKDGRSWERENGKNILCEQNPSSQ